MSPEVARESEVAGRAAIGASEGSDRVLREALFEGADVVVGGGDAAAEDGEEDDDGRAGETKDDAAEGAPPCQGWARAVGGELDHCRTRREYFWTRTQLHFSLCSCPVNDCPANPFCRLAPPCQM